MQILQYILISSVCLSLFYIAYKLTFSKETNFRQLRIYLMVSVLLSLLVPFNNYTIELRAPESSYTVLQPVTTQPGSSDLPVENTARPPVNWTGIAIQLYVLIALLLIGRIFLQIIVLTINYMKAEKMKHGDCVILTHHRFKNTFSFFRWIFIAPGAYSKEDLEQIIAHERIHASQYHSIDLIVIELLAAVMWFNPLIWKMKNSLKLVHEYLADEGALSTGIDKCRYQALLINQITEERLICLSSSFNHSLIKKRLIMITKSKIYQRKRPKLLTLIPLSASMLILVACLNGLFSENTKAITPSLTSGLMIAGGFETSNAFLPGDTIKKKTIVKVIDGNNPTDTVITETYTITVTGDSAKKDVLVWRTAPGDKGDTGKVVYFIDEEKIDELKSENHDSVTTVKVIKKGDHNEVITVEKTVKIKRTGDQDLDNTLFIIDGVKQTQNPLIEIDPDQIESINVINDKSEMNKYTDKEYDGILIIKTKASKE